MTGHLLSIGEVHMKRDPLTIGGTIVQPGRRAQVELPVSRLITGAEMAIPVVAVHGKNDGPTMWISAAIHGDEINGTEIVNQLLDGLDETTLKGTLLAVPVVNLYGFISGERYLPDRRDLNRSFPGSAKGSLAGRVAHLFMTEIVDRCEVGIDLHTASDHRTNLPHVRGNLDDAATRALATAFGGPLMLHAKSRSGTLRKAAMARGATILLFEAGEPSRFNKDAIEAGVTGVRRVMRHLGMAKFRGKKQNPIEESRSSSWLRAPRSGILHLNVELGDHVAQRQELGVITDAFGTKIRSIRATRGGLVISRTLHPLVNQGDAVVHIATLEST